MFQEATEQRNHSPCVLPWTTLKIDFTGDVYLCCANHAKLGNLKAQSLDEVWNGAPIQLIRSDLSKGRFKSSSCNNCPYVGVMPSIEKLPADIATRKSDIERAWNEGDVVVGSRPHELFLYFPYPCNLDCVMCMQVPLRSNRENMLPMDEILLDRVKEWSQANCGMLSMLGGEVFIQKRAIELIDYLVDNRLGNIHLSITTNGTVLHNFWRKLEWFDRLSLCFSIDAVDSEIYSRIRLKGHWPDVDRNIRRFREYIKERPKWSMMLAFVVQRQNLLHLVDIVRYAIEIDSAAYFSGMYGDHANAENPFVNPSILDETPGWEAEILTAIDLAAGYKTASTAMEASLRAVHRDLRNAANGPRNLVQIQVDQHSVRRELFQRVRDFLANTPPQRIACFGIGQDFRRMVSEGMFEGHEIVAIMDDIYTPGFEVSGYRIRLFEDLDSIHPDVIVATSSKYARELREKAIDRLKSLGLKTAVC